MIECGARELTVAYAELWIGLLACLVGGYFAACNIALKTFSFILPSTGCSDESGLG